MVGMLAITRQAPIAPHSVECSPVNAASPTGSVFTASLLIKTEATVYSFHTPRNTKVTAVAIAGFTRGMRIWKKERYTLAPSINADSSISFGSDLKDVAMIMLAKDTLKAM